MLEIAVIVALGVIALLAGGLIWAAHAALERADEAAAARELAAQREGEAAVDAHKVDAANDATKAAAAAETHQAQRGDALEKELSDDASRGPLTGAAGLSVLSDAEAPTDPRR